MKLAPDLDLAALRNRFEQLVPGVVAERAILPADAETARERLDASHPTPFFLAHRGRYETIDAPALAALVGAARYLAEQVVTLELAVLFARGLRLRRGDYALRRDDEAVRPATNGRLFEVLVDVSASSSGEAQVVYTRGRQPIFVAPQITGSFTLVERRAGIGRYQRYLNRDAGDRVIHKLQLFLAP